MCLVMQGQVRGSTQVKATKGPIDVLQVLVKIGKRERIEDVANFSGQEIRPGDVSLVVVPTVKAKNDRAYLNWATYDGVVT